MILVFSGIQKAKHEPWMDAFPHIQGGHSWNHFHEWVQKLLQPEEQIRGSTIDRQRSSTIDRRSTRMQTKHISSEHEKETSLEEHKGIHTDRARARQLQQSRNWWVSSIDLQGYQNFRWLSFERLDDDYYPFDNSISWLTTHTYEMKQDTTIL